MALPSALKLGALSLALLLAACTTTQPVRHSSRVTFEESSFADLPDVAPADWAPALSAFKASCNAMGAQGVWQEACTAAKTTDDADAKAFFEAQFKPWKVSVTKFEDEDAVSSVDSGLTTGYYEPLLYGSRTRQPPFVYPIYSPPDDLIQVDLSSVYPQLKGLRLRGKIEGRKLVPYDTRGDIQNRTDMERWAIAWVDDPVAAFFLHVQGSGRILLPDGSFMRVGFADQNGYRYKSIGQWLAKKGYLKPHELSMQRIRRWAQENPALVKEALAQNPSYVFFEERTQNPNQGPLGAQGVPLTSLASVAVDPAYWKLGTPFIVSVSQDKPALHYTRPVVAQDTGAAIKGPIRFDYFWGFGDEAGMMAGRQRSATSAWVLVPVGHTPQDVR